MAKKSGLGRSFASLIPTELLDESFDPTADQDGEVSDLRQIKLSEINPDPSQPRRRFEEEALEELATSIKEHGIIQPIVLTPSKNGYTIVAGERRYRASKMAGLEKVPALIRTLNNQHKLELSLIENLQRRDLNDLEIATAYLKLRDQFNMSHSQIAERMGVYPTSVSNKIRLLRLPDSVKEHLINGTMSEGQARPLVNVDKEVIEEILPQLVKESWSARKVEQFVVNWKNEGKDFVKKAVKKSADIAPYVKEREIFEKRFKMPVKIKTSKRGNGHLTISFKNDEEFQRLKKLLES